MELPDAVLGVSMYNSKFRGFLGLRANLKFRLQINSQPFQAGRLRMVWCPYYKYLGSRVNLWDSGTEYGMVSLSALPGVDIDIASNTECELQVPYVSPQLYYNLATGEGYWGKLYIVNYSPLVDPTGGGKVDCNLWFSFQDVDMAFPTGEGYSSSSVNPIAQIGSEERVLEKDRSFSSATAKFADALRSIPSVPFLDQITQPAAWASDRASDILKLFGLSKPESSNIPSFVKSNPLQFMPNSDGVNLSHSLSLLAGNSIEMMPDMTSCGRDEMSLNHIMSTPCYTDHFSWSSSAANNTQLWSRTIAPSSFSKSNTSDGTGSFVPTLLNYTTSCFAFWRGSIDFTFKIVKTKFHSGRLRIYFQPGAGSFDTTSRNFNYSQVVDIRSEDVIKFRVPYVSTKPWILTNGTFSTSNGPAFTTGVIYVEVLNELMATSTVSSTVDILVETSAGEDFEVAGPCQPTLNSVNVTASSSRLANVMRSFNSSSTSSTTRAKAQVGEEENREEEQSNIINKNQLGTKPRDCSWINVLAMHGEKVVSVRQLIKRSSQVGSVVVSAGNIILAPFEFKVQYSRTSGGTKVNTFTQSYLSHFLNLYAFWRGSVNYKIIPSKFQNNKAVCTALFSFQNSIPSQTSVVSAGTLTGVSTGGADQIIVQDLEGSIDITCPYYNQFHMCPITSYTFRDGNVQLGLFPPYLVTIGNLGSDTYSVYRSAADSFQMGYLLGPPLCESAV